MPEPAGFGGCPSVLRHIGCVCAPCIEHVAQNADGIRVYRTINRLRLRAGAVALTAAATVVLVHPAAAATDDSTTGLELLEPIPEEQYDPHWVWMAMYGGEVLVLMGMVVAVLFVIGRDGVDANRDGTWQRRL